MQHHDHTVNNTLLDALIAICLYVATNIKFIHLIEVVNPYIQFLGTLVALTIGLIRLFIIIRKQILFFIRWYKGR